jgi:serine/threonine protein kinase
MTPPDEMAPGPGETELVALRPGQTIGRYRIEAVLGQGDFGFIYRARDSRLGREVGIKEFLPATLAVRQGEGATVPRSNETAEEFARGRRHFLNEGRLLTGLQRAPCIVRVLDCLEANGTAYTVMELVSGPTLEDRLRGNINLSSADLDRILWPLLEGLEQVHAHGFFHGDIRPANIVLDPTGKPTLIEFGASRIGTMAAWTPSYAAPEQFASGKQGPWTDIYGLAATFYSALTGTPPPSARDRMPEDTCQPLTMLKPAGFSAGMLRGIDKGLALRVGDRPQTIAEWRSILWQTGKFGTSPSSPETSPDVEAAPPRKMRPRAAPPRAVPPAEAASPREAPSRQAPLREMPSREAPPEAPPRTAKAANADTPPPRRSRALWIGLATASVLALGGATYFLFAIPSSEPTQATATAANPEAAELVRQRAEMEAREKAEAAKRQEEEATRQRIEAEKAAIRRQVEEELQRKAEAEAEAKRRAEAADPKLAQAAETLLKLTRLDRIHVQAALTALGFDVRGADGALGPRSRQMIAAWQKSRNDPPTGFLNAAQVQALMTDGAAAIAKFDNGQKKTTDASATGSNPFDGEYAGSADVSTGDQPVALRVGDGKGSGSWKIGGCGKATFTLSIAPDGSAVLDLNGYTLQCEPMSRHYESHLESNSVQFVFSGNGDPTGGLTLTRQQN